MARYRLLGFVLCLSAVVCPTTLLACALPAPDGSYAVGSRAFQLEDATRMGVSGAPADASRVLPGRVWFPALRGGPPAPYLTTDEAAVQLPALARNLGYPPAETAALADCLTASGGTGIAQAPAGGFPLVVLDHGFFLYPAQNTALAQALASDGYVVLALAHPGDSVDVALEDGTVRETLLAPDAPALNAWRKAFHDAPDHATRTGLLDGYAKALAGSRLGDSQQVWRDDLLFAIDALQRGAVPDALRPLLAVTDVDRLAIVGMSFGGSTSATVCARRTTCRAAVSLDGLNFDPALFDAPVDRPLLLVHGDWIAYPMYDGTPVDPAYHANDYAYERWVDVGTDPRIVRIRVPGSRHMAFSDLPLLMPGDDPVARYGNAQPQAMARGLAVVVRAFVAEHLRDAPTTVASEIERAGFERHTPTQTRDWARTHERHLQPGD